jgi:hypothetical protein
VTARRYTDDERQHALELCAVVPLGQAARETGIPKSTLGTWCRRAGVRTFATEQTREANQAREVDLEARRQGIALRLYDEADAALDAITKPVPVYGMTRDGLGTGLAPAVNPADRQRLMTIAAIALDKAQLLTGQAIGRLDDLGGLDLEAEAMQARAEKVELAELRALRGAS